MTELESKTILIVDDSPANIGVISGFLKRQYKTKIATNGEKALLLVGGDEKPDLILLDIMMPGMDGYEVCRRLKANPATADIPVIFLTAKSDAENEEHGFAVGAVDYIQKPFLPAVVLARVRTQLALRQAVALAQAAQRQADQLLECLLPRSAAEEIRTMGTVLPRRYDNVAVMFCDVVDFTSFCDLREPEELVARLDALFVAFEQVAEAHGLEKIKTIGDAFMLAGGLLNDIDDPLDAAVSCGLALASSAAASQLDWDVRVGVHVGPVVAGIVGQQRFQFDIWGDTVNVAARMASKAMPGKVTLTATAYESIKHRYAGEPLGELEVKGKGSMPVVQISGLRTGA